MIKEEVYSWFAWQEIKVLKYEILINIIIVVIPSLGTRSMERIGENFGGGATSAREKVAAAKIFPQIAQEVTGAPNNSFL